MAAAGNRRMPLEWYEVAVDTGGDADIRLAAFPLRADATDFAEGLACHIRLLDKVYPVGVGAAAAEPPNFAHQTTRDELDAAGRAFLPYEIDPDVLANGHVQIYHVQQEAGEGKAAGIIGMRLDAWRPSFSRRGSRIPGDDRARQGPAPKAQSPEQGAP